MIETSQTTTFLPHMEFGTQGQSLSELYLIRISWPKPHHYCRGGARPPNRTWDEFLPHTARAEDRGSWGEMGRPNCCRSGRTGKGAGISLWRSKLIAPPPKNKPTQQENVCAGATKRSSLACCFAFFLFHPSPFRDRRLIESNMCSSRRLTNRLGHQTTCARPFCLALNGMALLVTLCPDPSPHVRFYPPATRPTQH